MDGNGKTFTTQEERDDAAYPATEYKKQTFSFSKEELAEISPIANAVEVVRAFIVLGGIAQKAVDGFVGNQVLNRCGIKTSEDVRFSYDVPGNKLIVYEPRYWCSSCGNRRAEYKYESKEGNVMYCQNCIQDKKKEINENKKAQETKNPSKKKQ